MPQALLAAVPEIMAAVGPALRAGATSRVANFAEGKMSGSGDKKKESKQAKLEPTIGNQIVPLGV